MSPRDRTPQLWRSPQLAHSPGRSARQALPAPTLRPLRLRGCGPAQTCASARHTLALSGPQRARDSRPAPHLPAPSGLLGLRPSLAPLSEFFLRQRGLGARSAPAGTRACALEPNGVSRAFLVRFSCV